MEKLAKNIDVKNNQLELFRLDIHEGKLFKKLESGDREFDVFLYTKIKLYLRKENWSPFSFDFQDHRRNHFDIFISPLFDDDDELSGLSILKKKNGQGSIEALLRENRTLGMFKKAIDKHAVLMVINKQGRITEVNERFLEVSGYSQDEILLSPVKILNSGFHSKEFWKDLWRKVLKGNIFQEEIRNVGKLGNYFWLDTTIVPVFDEFDRFQYFVSISQDITEIKNNFRKKLERQFQLASIGKVAARLSHEINNPLCVISTVATRMKIMGESDKEREAGSLIEKNIKRIETIAESILRGSRKSQTSNLTSFNVGDVFDHLSSIFSMRSKEEKVSLIFKANSISAYANYDYVVQILINLISNAFDAVRFSSDAQIQVLTKQHEDYLEIIVRDNGQLINDLIKKEIFQEFFTTKSEDMGTGIGLSISKDMAQKMGGDLTLEQICQKKDFILRLNNGKANE
ncbi:MAG: hypothetical protein BM556_15875 [Bacteriovorax sp. MedPE-SWde]|nr:MAG: hypothetical protein BM556_15875 [Bacteriovorax sp. MedPE-SWde]